MSRVICKDCAEELGSGRKYLISMISNYNTEDKSLQAYKNKLINFFGGDLQLLDIEKRLIKLEEKIATIGGRK